MHRGKRKSPGRVAATQRSSSAHTLSDRSSLTSTLVSLHRSSFPTARQASHDHGTRQQFSRVSTIGSPSTRSQISAPLQRNSFTLQHSDHRHFSTSSSIVEENPSTPPAKPRRKKGSILRPRPSAALSGPFLISDPSHASFSETDSIEVTTRLSGQNPSMREIAKAITETLNQSVPTHLDQEDMIQISLPDIARILPTANKKSPGKASPQEVAAASTPSAAATPTVNIMNHPIRPPIFASNPINDGNDSDRDIPPFLRKYKELVPTHGQVLPQEPQEHSRHENALRKDPAAVHTVDESSNDDPSRQLSLQEQAQKRFSKLSPPHIVAYLDLHVIAQLEAKQSLAIAVRNRERRFRLSSMTKPKSIQSIEEIGLRIAQQHGYRVSEDLAGSIGKPVQMQAQAPVEGINSVVLESNTKTKAGKSKSKQKNAPNNSDAIVPPAYDADGEEYSAFNPRPRHIDDIIKQFGLAHRSDGQAHGEISTIIDQFNTTVQSHSQDFGQHMINEISPFNILMVGPTGSGKTELVKRLCNYLDSPYTQADATRYTETGVIGSDIDSIIGDLYKDALNREKKLEIKRLEPRGRRRAVQSIVTAIKNHNNWNAVFDVLDKRGLTSLYTSPDPHPLLSQDQQTAAAAVTPVSTTQQHTPSFYMGDFGMNKQPASTANKDLPVLEMDKKGFKVKDVEQLLRSGAVSQVHGDLTFLVKSKLSSAPASTATENAEKQTQTNSSPDKKGTKTKTKAKAKKTSSKDHDDHNTVISSDTSTIAASPHEKKSTKSELADQESILSTKLVSGYPVDEVMLRATITTSSQTGKNNGDVHEPGYLARGPVSSSAEDFFNKDLHDASSTYGSLVKTQQQHVTKFIPSHSELTEWIDKGYLDDLVLEVDLPQRSAPSPPPATLDIGVILATIDPAGSSSSKTRRNVKTVKQTVSVKSALDVLTEHEASMFLDEASLSARAIANAERNGVVFIDEVDKLIPVSSHEVRSSTSSQKGEGVQRELLSLLQGKTCNVQGVQIKTDGILFICAGAFHHAQPSQLLPELQGRLPVVTKLQPLTKIQMALVLTLPIYSVLKQYVSLMKSDGVDVRITDDAIWEIAQSAYDLNERSLNLGARRLNNIVNSVFGHISYHYANGLKFDVDEITGKIKPINHHSTPSGSAGASDVLPAESAASGNRRHHATNNTLRTNIPIKSDNITVLPNDEVRIVVDAEYVKKTLGHMMKDIDISKYLL